MWTIITKSSLMPKNSHQTYVVFFTCLFERLQLHGSLLFCVELTCRGPALFEFFCKTGLGNIGIVSIWEYINYNYITI